MTQAFETEFAIGIGTLTGGITGVEVKEKDSLGNFQPSLIIRTDRDWQVTVKWAVIGSMLDIRWLNIGGKWLLKAYLEGWGKGADEHDQDGDIAGGVQVDGGQDTIVKKGSVMPPDNPPETEWHYVETFTFPAGTIKPGTYKLAVAITFEDDQGVPGAMAGFIEYADMVQIYNPGP